MMGHGNNPPADRAIALLGCAGAALTLAVVVIASAVAGSGAAWIVSGSLACGACALVAIWSLVLVRRDGFFHDESGDEEDEDGNPPGGSGVRYPPDAPDGGGTLEFDWDSFVTNFWDYVDASAPVSPALEPARQ